MSSIFLPPKVAKELREERLRHSGEIKDCVLIDGPWTERLQEVDPNLYMVRTREWVKAGLPLLPGGFFHIIRDNSDKGAPETIIPLEDDGKFVEPGSWVFGMLALNDLQRPGALRELREREERVHKAQEKLRQEEREARQAEVLERYLAGSRTFVSMNRHSPWTQNAKGRRPK